MGGGADVANPVVPRTSNAREVANQENTKNYLLQPILAINNMPSALKSNPYEIQPLTGVLIIHILYNKICFLEQYHFFRILELKKGLLKK